jgi:F-type H+-transporting ATPase subunit b
MREELIAKARKEADEARLQAQREIQAERQKAVAEIRGHAVELAFALAEKLIGEKLDDNRHRALAEQFIEQLPRAAQEQERLRP